MSEKPGAPRRENPYRGSELSDKQIAFAVKDKKRTTVVLPCGVEVAGYIFGSDRYHWTLVTSELDVWLIHKSGAAIRFGAANELDAEPRREALEKITGKFRERILRTQFADHRPPLAAAG